MAAVAYRYNDSSAYAIPDEYTYPARAPAREREWEREREKERARQAAAVPTIAISPFAILGFVFFAVLLMLTVLANVSLTEISRETARQEARLENLTAAGKKLRVEYETVFDLDEIEVYATSVLGMTYNDTLDTGYVQTFMHDKAVIMDNKVTAKNIAGELVDFIKSLLQYVKQP